MSIRPWKCPKCQHEGTYLGLRLHAGEDEWPSYGVGWACPGCDAKVLDVCPLGPLLPGEEFCLNCGRPYAAAGPDAACPACGLTRTGVRAFFELSEAPPDPEAAARDLFGRGLFRRGLAVLNEALRRDPSREGPWLLKASFLEGLGLHGLAARLLEGALARGAPPALLINGASALHRAGRCEEAAAASRKYLGLQPDGPWAGAARTNLGVALRALGRDAEAEEVYREAIRVDPGQVVHYRNLGQLLVDQRRWSGAIGVLEAGLGRATEAEDKARFLEGLSYVHAEDERGEPALRHAEQTLALGEDGARVHYLRGRALALLGRLEEARAEMRLVLEREPENAEARQAMGLIDEALAKG
jgi:tetratricopeptide (TPR) repeat protein